MQTAPATRHEAVRPAPDGRPRRGAVGAAALRCVLTVFRADGGVAALEFGLFAPILFVSLLAMVDVGFALNERMTIDHVLRAGAQTAMNGGDEAAVLDVLETTASKNFTGDQTLALTVDYRHACPENPDVPVAPTHTCDGPAETSIYFRLTGAKSYNGIFLPTIELAPSMEVQVR